VHAAKGLEFPVVFLVNLARGTGNRRDYIRIGTHLESGALEGGAVSGVASVAVGDFISEYDEDAQAREREETKRLLYVALTRARDRLYLSSVLKDSRIAPGRGSLAEVLPPALLECFASAAAGLPAEWRASSGHLHAFRVCGAPDAGLPAGPHASAIPPATDDPAADDLDALDAAPSVRRATEVDVLTGPGVAIEPAAGSESERLLGTVVHRLLQALGTTAPESGDVAALALQLLRPDESAGLADRDGFASRAAAAYRALRDHAEVRSLYAAAEIFHEVPFVVRHEGAIVRGTIDCLVRVDDGEVSVLEFKTGRPRPEHAGQVALYASVAAQLFPGAVVTPKLIYTGLGALP